MDRVTDYDALWDSGIKCKCGVMWKPSTKHYNLNMVEETHRMERKLKDGTWKNSKPRPILIIYPKKREGLSIPFRDRVYQRSINDNVLYPNIQRSFILDNCACQTGKGIDFARKRLKKHLWNFYCNHGTDGYVLQIDIKGYYPNMRHDVVEAKFKRYLPDDVFKAICDVLDTQHYTIGEKLIDNEIRQIFRFDENGRIIGFSPGSQMIQIAGISLLDDLDHYCKEKLHLKHYIRYMDDIFIVHHDKEELLQALSAMEEQLVLIGFSIHKDKTHITPLSQGFTFLGFDYRITSTGKVLMTLNSANVKHERKKLRRLVNLAKKGVTTKAKVDECYRSWKANANKGNSYNLLKRMDDYYKDLWKENEHDS